MNLGLYLTNTLSGKKEPFMSREAGKVKLFTCGPSTYSRAHVGNYRTFLYEDVLQRHLEYLGYDVERMIHFTDVEDKAIEEARARGMDLKTLTGSVEDRFFKEVDRLAIKLPAHIPRSSTSVDQAVHLIKILLDKGYAYRHEKDIFFDPLKFEGFGKLYGLDMGRWPKKRRRFRKDTYPGQRWNLGDFILWHGGDANGVYWDTDIGRGRPAWNIQDAAMITKTLGFRVDIACGGVDNLFRHHDYTIAITEAVSEEPFSCYWLHGEHVLVNRAKMSKSRKNIVYLEDLTQQGYVPRFVRFFLIYGHYRNSLKLSIDNLERNSGKLVSVDELIARLARGGKEGDPLSRQGSGLIRRMEQGFRERMNDDLDVKGAFDGVRDTLRRLMEVKAKGKFTGGDAQMLRRTIAKIQAVFQIFDTRNL